MRSELSAQCSTDGIIYVFTQIINNTVLSNMRLSLSYILNNMYETSIIITKNVCSVVTLMNEVSVVRVDLVYSTLLYITV